jgi:hypothetical protein
MKAALLTIITAISMTTFLSTGAVYAQEAGKTAVEKNQK